MLNHSTKIVVRRYPPFLVALVLLFLFFIIVGCFVNLRFIIVALFILPVVFIFSLWMVFDKIAIQKDANYLYIKIVDRALSNKYKIPLGNVKAVRFIEQQYKFKKQKRNALTSGMAAFTGISKDVNAGKAKVLCVQTAKQNIRIGAYLSEDKKQRLYRFLKQELG